jgi:hypothetical protein
MAEFVFPDRKFFSARPTHPWFDALGRNGHRALRKFFVASVVRFFGRVSGLSSADRAADRDGKFAALARKKILTPSAPRAPGTIP